MYLKVLRLRRAFLILRLTLECGSQIHSLFLWPFHIYECKENLFDLKQLTNGFMRQSPFELKIKLMFFAWSHYNFWNQHESDIRGISNKNKHAPEKQVELPHKKKIETWKTKGSREDETKNQHIQAAWKN